MKKSEVRFVLQGFIAGLVMGVLLVWQIPKFLETQRPAMHHPDYTKASLVKTGHPYDLAIVGRGYFQLLLPDGSIGFTRNSHFTLDETGRLISVHGYPLSDGIVIPMEITGIEFGMEGIVQVYQEPNSQTVLVGNIQIAGFINPDGLQRGPNGVLLETEKSGPPIPSDPAHPMEKELYEVGTVKSGYLNDVPRKEP